VDARTLAAGKKNARRRHAWLVFEDESGLSQLPVVRRTWAPRGQTPVLTHTLNDWQRVSVAAVLAFRWDGRRVRLYFQTRATPYRGPAVVDFLRALRRHFRRARAILLWDGLPAHRGRVVQRYLGAHRSWLTVERLPAYAPELNPVEALWGNVKGQECANLCAPDRRGLLRPLHRGLRRVRRRPHLAFSFLAHAGLSL
jgi:transposase